MTQLINEVGNRFGRLLVLERVENGNGGQARWVCLCDCGNILVVAGFHLRSGHTKSCGCYKRERSSETCKNRIGKVHHNWQGGITTENHKIRNSVEYKAWRLDVFERDGFTCQFCGDNRGGNLNAHHIFSFAKHEDLIFDINNGITLCKECHNFIHSNKNENSIFKEEV